MKLIKLKDYPIYEQLQLEEALLRTDSENYCIINQGSPRSIVLGISGKPENFVHPRATEDQIPLIKRYSGGGTVIVDENTLFVSFICQKDLLEGQLFPEPIMRWSTKIYQKAFQIPEFELKENDYVISNQKCGGNAQYIRKDRFVHHTTFLWDFEDKNMDYLLHPVKTPSYREKRSHTDFLCRLKPYFQNADFLVGKIEEELNRQFNAVPITHTNFLHLLQRDYRRSTVILSSAIN